MNRKNMLQAIKDLREAKETQIRNSIGDVFWDAVGNKVNRDYCREHNECGLCGLGVILVRAIERGDIPRDHPTFQGGDYFKVAAEHLGIPSTEVWRFIDANDVDKLTFPGIADRISRSFFRGEDV